MFTPNLTQYAQGAGKQESVRWGENGGPGKSAERGQVFSRRSRQKIWRGDCLITEGISVKSSSLWFFYIEVLFCNPLDYFCLLDFFHDFLHDQFLDVPITLLPWFYFRSFDKAENSNLTKNCSKSVDLFHSYRWRW